MPYTTIDKPSDYFNTKLYTGTNATQSITGVGFQPDLSWFKTRSDANGHTLIDSVRGITKRLASHNTQGDITQADMLTSFDTDGLTLGADSNNYTNWSGKTWVVWNWLASNTTASNTDGTITSTVSANQTSGFSIVSYTGTGSNATVGHGLSAVPSVIIIKDRDNGTGYNWRVYHHKNTSAPETDVLVLNLTNATNDNVTYWNDTAPTSSVFTIGTDLSLNNSGDAHIAYCFAEKKGYSKFGSYTGNGSTDGTFVYLGFKPAFVIIKRTSSAQNWGMYDNKREPFNTNDAVLFPNLSNAETSSVNYALDFVSNGFKQRATGNQSNGSGQTYIYMAFAENPFTTSTGIPCTAR
jgi:hypothetical protein